MPLTPWPSLPLGEWRDTRDTLQRWLQIVGKICLSIAPPTNHYWGTTLRVVPRGLRTPTLYSGGAAHEMTFDFVDHQLLIARDDGASRRVELRPRTVADFYAATMQAAQELGLQANIWPVPVEIPGETTRFDRDEGHAAYDASFVQRFARVLRDTARVLETFRAGFLGKASPVHLFWGSLDLAATRFSGRRAPERPGADAVTREAYSHEVISHGFWPGGGGFPDAAFYAYAAPIPPGLEAARVSPTDAFYHRELGEFILPYEAVRSADQPDRALMEFLETTYAAAADLAGWDRAALERTPAASFERRRAASG